MVLLSFSQLGHLGHKGKGLGKVIEFELFE
jgi:hypothetical protein